MQRGNKALFSYVDTLVKTNINEDALINGRSRNFFYNPGLKVRQSLENIKGMTAQFIESQSFSWLYEFYKWISETKHRKELILKKPVFLDQDGKAAAAFDQAGQLILFLPAKNITGYTMVHPALLADPGTKKFIEEIGIKSPSLRDQIYNIILPQYQEGKIIDSGPHFKLFFDYYCKCSNDEVADFIELIEGYEFLNYYVEEDPRPHRGAASTMYLPTPKLKAYFESKPGTRFIAIDMYKELVGASKEKRLISFLIELGIKTEIDVLSVSIDYNHSGRSDLPHPYSTRGTTWEEFVIDGCKEIVEFITTNKDKEKSILLWDCLLGIIEAKCSRYTSLSALLRGTCHYFYYSPQRTSLQHCQVVSLN